jgi:hypothetical protein
MVQRVKSSAQKKKKTITEMSSFGQFTHDLTMALLGLIVIVVILDLTGKTHIFKSLYHHSGHGHTKAHSHH